MKIAYIQHVFWSLDRQSLKCKAHVMSENLLLYATSSLIG